MGEMDKTISQYRFGYRLQKETEEVQVNSLFYAMGDSADDVLKTLTFDSPEDKEKFDSYFTVRHNVIYDRAKFNQRKQ